MHNSKKIVTLGTTLAILVSIALAATGCDRSAGTSYLQGSYGILTAERDYDEPVDQTFPNGFTIRNEGNYTLEIRAFHTVVVREDQGQHPTVVFEDGMECEQVDDTFTALYCSSDPIILEPGEEMDIRFAVDGSYNQICFVRVFADAIDSNGISMGLDTLSNVGEEQLCFNP